MPDPINPSQSAKSTVSQNSAYGQSMQKTAQKYIQEAQKLEEEAGGKNDPEKLKQAKVLKDKVIEIQLKIDRAKDQYQQAEEKNQEFKASKANLEKRLEELGGNKNQHKNAGGRPVGFNSLINLLTDALGLGKLNKGGFGGGRPANVGAANGGLTPGLPASGVGDNNASALGNGLGYLAAAKAILKAIALVTMQSISAHPIPNIARSETNEKLARLAISYLDAAQVDSALQGTVANQDIIFTKTQASTIEGDAKTAKAYWTQALQNDKQDNKDTHKLADRA